MKIIVFGATGRTGKELIKQAAAQGHSVTAFARNPDEVPKEPGVRIVHADLFDAAAVADAIAGNRAVLSALGQRDLKKQDLLVRAVPILLNGMFHYDLRRIIVLGSAATRKQAGKYENAITNMGLWLARKTVLRHPIADQQGQERLLEASEADYTVVRAPLLTDGPFTGSYRVLPDAMPPGALRISRADVADFMLKQLTDPRFHRQGPYIGS